MNTQGKTVPEATVEFAVEALWRVIKRLIIIIIILIIALVGSNIAWIIYENQFEDSITTTSQTVEQEADNGENHFIGGDYYGKADS